MLAQQLFNGVIIGAVYALFALGFNLVFGVHKIMNLAHGAIFMVGAFLALYAVQLGLPLWLAFILAMLACGVTGVVLDFLAFRPLRKRGEAEFAAIMSSIGANMILMNIALQISEGQVFRFPFGLVPLAPLQFFGLRVGVLQLIVCALMVVTVLALGYYPRRICPFCLSGATKLRPVRGTGVIHSLSAMRKADQPYVIAYVELPEGVTILTNLTDCEPEDLAIGQPVTLRFSRSSSGMAVPVFGPAPDI